MSKRFAGLCMRFGIVPRFCLLLIFLVFSLIQTGFCKVVINEIMYHPSTLQSDDEFIELYNTGPDAVDLSGWKFSNGITFSFPANTVMAPNSYLLLSPSLEAFKKQYGDLPVMGPYTGKLSNDGETVEIVDAAGKTVDKVKYKNEEGWPITADGDGASMELLHPDMPSSQPQSWAASPKGGTPGKSNSVLLAAAFPVVNNVIQSRVLPKSSEPVHITVEVRHHKPIQTVVLHYKKESEMTYLSTPMLDDGLHGDTAAQDGIYGADIPAQADGSIVEFYAEAVDSDAVHGTMPLAGTARPLFYAVDDSVYASSAMPVYRIVMRSKDEKLLRSRNPNSNDFLPVTFIHGNDIYHDADIRFRGKGSRGSEPKSYRIDFTNTRYFGKIRKLNLNGSNPIIQYIGMEALTQSGIITPAHQLVSIVFNRTVYPRYHQIERMDKDFLNQHYADASGNLYRGIENADFNYLGTDKERYRSLYKKYSNEKEDDFSDLFPLCEAFTTLPDATFAIEISKRINTMEWIRYFAACQVLNDMEGGIQRERGDDYFIYHNPQDDRFDILPWDMDSVLDPNYLPPHHHGVKAVQRLLRHPDLARFYYQQMLSLMNNELSVENMAKIIDKTSPLSTTDERSKWLSNYAKLCELNRAAIPQKLTVEYSAAGSQNELTLVPERSAWKFFRGKTEPAGASLDWTKTQYDDSNWESGKGVLGYGETYIDTPINDVENNYLTVFFRQAFTIQPGQNFSKLTLNVMYDDGFVAYLNGIEIGREHIDGVPSAQSRSDSSHEADNAYHEFPINPLLLVPGQNVLAVVVANNSINSSDLVMDANLTGEVSDSSQVSFKGLTDAANTRYVQVNKLQTTYEPWTGKWVFNTALIQGKNEFLIEAVDASSKIVDSTAIVIYEGTQPPENTENVLTADKSPYQFDGNLIVGATETLIIDPGVTLQFPKSAGIVVFGTFTANGTAENPVNFTARSSTDGWGAIGIEKAAGKAEICYASFTAAKGFSYNGKTYGAAVNIDESTVTVDHCYFNQDTTYGMECHSSFVTASNSVFSNSGEGIHCNTCSSIIENNLFNNLHGYNDAIDFDFDLAHAPRSVIRHNHITGSEDDCIDMGDASPLIEGNFIENAKSGKGLSLEGVSTPEAINNVIVNCGIGIAIKDKCDTLMINNTIVNCTAGVSIYEKNQGKGGGKGTLMNSVIWGAKEAVSVDALSTVTALSNDLMDLKNASDPSNFSKDPMFTTMNRYPFYPAKGSPLIDAGRDKGITTDILSSVRPKGTAPDIGAYETDYPTNVENWMMQ